MEKSTLRMTVFILMLNAINLLSTQQHLWQKQSSDNLHSTGQWFRMDKKGHIWRSHDLTSWVNITQLFPSKKHGQATDQDKYYPPYATQPIQQHLDQQPKQFYIIDNNVLLLED